MDTPGSTRYAAVGSAAQPTLELRVPIASDASAWFELFDDPEVMRYISGGKTRSLDWYREFVAHQQSLAAASGLCLFALVIPDARAAVTAARSHMAGGSVAPGTAPTMLRAGEAPQSTLRAGGATETVFHAGAAPDSPPHAVVAGFESVVAGFVGIQPWSRPWGPVARIEIGWRLGKRFHGRGLATAGAREALERGRAMGVDSPVAMIDLENAASMSVAAKLGMSCQEQFDSPEGRLVGMWGFPLATAH